MAFRPQASGYLGFCWGYSFGSSWDFCAVLLLSTVSETFTCIHITWGIAKTDCNSVRVRPKVLLFQEASRWTCWLKNILWVSKALTFFCITYSTHGRKIDLSNWWDSKYLTFIHHSPPVKGVMRAEVTCWVWPPPLPSPFAAALPRSGFSFPFGKTPRAVSACARRSSAAETMRVRSGKTVDLVRLHIRKPLWQRTKIQPSKSKNWMALLVIHELGSITSSNRKVLWGVVQNGRLLWAEREWKKS